MLKSLALFFCVLLSCPCLLAGKRTYGPYLISKIWSVYDGDTFTADIEGLRPIAGEKIGIRLKGIDTAEMRGGTEATKEKAREARLYLIEVLSKADRVEIRDVERGKYFRLVGRLYVDGVDVADEMVRLELALPYTGGKKANWELFIESLK